MIRKLIFVHSIMLLVTYTALLIPMSSVNLFNAEEAHRFFHKKLKNEHSIGTMGRLIREHLKLRSELAGKRILSFWLLHALSNKKFELAQILLNYGADFDTRSYEDETASLLEYFAQRRADAQVIFLLQNGADPSEVHNELAETDIDGIGIYVRGDFLLDHLLSSVRCAREHDLEPRYNCLKILYCYGARVENPRWVSDEQEADFKQAKEQFEQDNVRDILPLDRQYVEKKYELSERRKYSFQALHALALKSLLQSPEPLRFPAALAEIIAEYYQPYACIANPVRFCADEQKTDEVNAESDLECRAQKRGCGGSCSVM